MPQSAVLFASKITYAQSAPAINGVSNSLKAETTDVPWASITVIPSFRKKGLTLGYISLRILTIFD